MDSKLNAVEKCSLCSIQLTSTLVTHPHKGHKNSPLIKQKPDQTQEKMECIQCKSAIGARDMDGPEPNHHCHVPCKHYQYWRRSHNCPWKPCHNCHCTTLYLAVSFQINTFFLFVLTNFLLCSKICAMHTWSSNIHYKSHWPKKHAWNVAGSLICRF